jgi:signal transduction histidine kinase/DNA-binding response OmpR family regulator
MKIKRNKWKRGSIKKRIIVLFMGAACFALFSFLPLQLIENGKLVQETTTINNESVRSLTIDNCHFRSKVLLSEVEEGLASMHLSEVVDSIRNFAEKDEFVDRVKLLRKGDLVFVDTAGEGVADFKPMTQRKLSSVTRSMVTFYDKNHFRIILPVYDASEHWGALVVYHNLTPLVQKEENLKIRMSSRLRNVMINTLITFLVYFVIIYIIIYYLSSKLSSPIEALTKNVDEFDIECFDSSNQPLLGNNDEVTVLHEAFINMAENLQTSYKKLKNNNVILEDTVQKRTKELYQKNEVLEKARREAIEANEAKSQFLASVSHEVRTPINGILGAEKLLQSTALNSRQKHFADTIASSAGNLLITINDLLDFAKIEAGKLVLENTKFDILDVVEEALNMVAVNAYRKKLQLGVIFGPALPDTVTLDSHRMNQVITNLLSNAVKFTKSGFVKVEISYDGDNLLLNVQDTGIGISREQQDKLFQPFIQAESSTTRRFGGTGLGLAICRSIVEQMNGRLTLRSEPGEGAVFSVSIPVEAEPHKQSAVASEFKDEKIILAINDMLLSRSLISMLGRLQVPFSLMIGKSVSQSIVITDNINEDFGCDNRTIRLIPPSRNDFHITASNSALILPLTRSKIVNQLQFICGKTDENFSAENFLMENRPHIEILLAEDHPVNQDVFLSTLEQMGFSADLAENGDIAVKRALEKPYDIIFMDCEMPVMDGFEATEKIREYNKTVPIIAVTAYDIASERERAFKAGITEFIPKPVKYEDILKVISEHTREKQLQFLVDVVDMHLGLKDRSKGMKYLSIFVTSNRAAVEKLSEVEKLDEQEINEVLHKIAGSAATIGLTKLAALARKYDHSLCHAVVSRFKEVEKIVGV